jgi:hypothetical protein
MDTVTMYEETLDRLLGRLDIDESRYSLRAGLPEGGYAVARRGAEWVVYYVERGQENVVSRFPNQQGAVDELVKRLIRNLDRAIEHGYADEPKPR